MKLIDEEIVSSLEDVTTMLTSQTLTGAPANRSLIWMVTAWVDDESRLIEEVDNVVSNHVEALFELSKPKLTKKVSEAEPRLVSSKVYVTSEIGQAAILLLIELTVKPTLWATCNSKVKDLVI